MAVDWVVVVVESKSDRSAGRDSNLRQRAANRSK